MTFEQYIRKQLDEAALFPEDVEAVIKRIKDAPENKVMENLWHRDLEGYPATMQKLAEVTMKRHALLWIEETCPDAWFKVCFLPEEVK